MSVTQNYKTFKLSASDDVIQYIVIAVMQKLFADQDRIRVTDSPALVSFLSRDIAFRSDALIALNCGTMRYQALEGALLATVLRELRTMRRLVKDGAFGLGELGRLDDMDAVLLFLENPK